MNISKSQTQTIDQLDIVDLDCIYLSYDEPQKEEFWLKIKDMVPWAKRVDGVHGSDAAHKAAAQLSNTERFILIDGDNMPDARFFNLTLDITEKNKNAQFRWRAKNYVNGLHYGNGGLSSWTKTFVMNMRTHENTDGSHETNIEFCFDPLYWPMHDCYSTTYINYTPKQAWRAGFREGVKMCTRSGLVPKDNSSFLTHVWPRNLRNLSIWHTVGRDVKNGFYAILGARLGTHYLMLRDWDHTDVRDFAKLDDLWELHNNDDEHICSTLANELNQNLGLNIVELNDNQSKFFKDYISNNWYNRGPMIKEIDIIKEQEGW
jgi:hypothetical protein